MRSLRFPLLLLPLGTALALVACDDGGSRDPLVGSETHFLRACSDSCAAGLSCVCGVCTAPCEAATECGALAENASCQATPSTCGDAAPPTQRCEVECMADTDCAGISPDHRCMDGACRAPALPVEDMSMDVSDTDTGDVGPCMDDSQCAAGESCIDGACIGPMTCTSNADCPVDTECIDGVCDGSAFACLGCGPGTVCIDGQCLAVCASDAECAAGEVCIAGDCVAGCPAPGAMCDMACVDLTRNIEHCGACNTACPPETRCESGACVADFCMADADCAAGQACLAGACGVACAADSDCAAGELCTAGACIANCAPGQVLCADGCADLTTSTTHCGGCGVACAAGETCVDGACQ